MGQVSGIEYKGKSPEGIPSEIRVLVMDVLEKRGSDDIDGGLVAHFFHKGVDKSSEVGVVGLQEFGDGEKEGSSFVISESLALVEQVDKFGEGGNAGSGVDLAIIECFCLVDGRSLVNLH